TAPLTDGELHTLLGTMPAPERRLNPRFVPSSETLSHLTIKLKDHDLPMILNDISVGGMRVVVRQPFVKGTELEVDLINKVTKTHCVVLFRLLHFRPRVGIGDRLQK